MKHVATKSNKKDIKKIVLISVAIVVLAASGVFAYRHFTQKPAASTDTGSVNYDPPTQEEKSTGDAIKEQGLSGSDQAPQPTTPASPSDTHSTVGMDITALNQASGTLYIRTLIQAVTSSGKCYLTMKGPDGKAYSASVGVQAGPSSSTCAGFDIPVSSLDSGTWSVSITFENDTLRGAATKDVAVQ